LFDALSASENFFVLIGGWLQVRFEVAFAGDVAVATEKNAVVTDNFLFITDRA